MNYEDNIGKNIYEARMSSRMTQQQLAEKCNISNTTLSAYENKKKIPNLKTTAIIAKALNVTIERLYYGDDDNAFISSVPDEGRKIVNSIYCLWSNDVINYTDSYSYDNNSYNANISNSDYLYIFKYSSAISRLLKNLHEFRQNKSTFESPDVYLEILFTSVATEINVEIQKEKEYEEMKKKINNMPTPSNMKRKHEEQ